MRAGLSSLPSGASVSRLFNSHCVHLWTVFLGVLIRFMNKSVAHQTQESQVEFRTVLNHWTTKLARH
jgi:hypothetical protein